MFSFPSQPTSPRERCVFVKVESNKNKFKGSGGRAWGVILKEFRTVFPRLLLNKGQNALLGGQERE